MTMTIECLSYVPVWAQRYCEQHPTPLNSPVEEHFSAAVMFADVSGFTALTERLAKLGPSGLETLTDCLNTYFDKLIALISAHGGDVVKFAGDALLAIWPVAEPAESLATVTRRAVQCSAIVQQRLHKYEVVQSVYLCLKLAIAAGDVKVMYLGGVGEQWNFFIAGDPLEQIGLASGSIKPGEIAVSSPAWALVSEHCIAQPKSEGAMQLQAVRNSIPPSSLETPTLTPEAFLVLQTLVPRMVLLRLAAGQSNWLAELRRVTVLFVNLPFLKAETSLEQAHKAIHLLQTIINRYEGSINKLSVDDKGSTLIAAFGMPPFSHEDDAVRGVQSALEIQNQLGELAVQFAIGVTTGPAFCGLVGSEKRREYTLMGDVVNLSARLMQAAGNGEILCDEKTFQIAHNKHSFISIPAIKVKGKRELVAVYKPILACPISQFIEQNLISKVSLVGRDRERKLLVEALKELRLQSDNCATVILEGEPGIGKSTVVKYLLEKGRSLPIKVLSGVADAIEKTTLYYAWRDIFSQLLDVRAFSEPEAERQRILGLLSSEPDLVPLAPFLNEVLPLDFPETEITAAMVGKERAEFIRNFLVQFLQIVLNKTPTLLVLEDANWMDSASWALALMARDCIRPLLLVIATRPLTPYPPDEYRQLLASRHTHYLQLQPLPEEEALVLACQRLGVNSLPASIAELIRTKTQGNPFFTEEFAYALRDSGVIAIENGECRIAAKVDDITSLNLPDTVQGVITSRIDLLTPSEQLTLKVASVIGRVFAFKILRDIYPLEADKDQLKDYLQVLDRFDLTPQETPEPELAYIFKHFITQEVSYNLMLFSQRRRLHQVVASWYEGNYGSENSDYYETLAYHYERGEVWKKALEYLVKAGQKAQRSHANPEALASYNRALAICDRLGTTVESSTQMTIYAGIGQIHFVQSKFQLSVEAYEQMLSLARKCGDRYKEADALYNIGHAWLWAHEFEKALKYGQQSKQLALEIDCKNILAASYYLIGFTEGMRGNPSSFFSGARKALKISKKIEDYSVQGCTLFGLAIVYVWQGNYEKGVAVGEQGIALLQTGKFQFLLLLILWTLSMNCGSQGKYERALSFLHQGLHISDRLSDKFYKSRLLNTWGWVYLELYNIAPAIRYNLDAIDIVREIGDLESIRNAEINLGDCYLMLGDLERAGTYLEKVYLDCQQYGKVGEEWMKWRYLQHCCHSFGELQLLRGNAEAALNLAEECLKLAEPTISRKNLVKGWRLKGQALLAQGKIEEAEVFLNKAIAQAIEIGNPKQLWVTYQALGELYQQKRLFIEAREADLSAIQAIEKTAESLQSADVKQTFLASHQVQKIRKDLESITLLLTTLP